MSEDLQHLVTAARHNDASAWDHLFRRYQLPLFTYARSFTRDRAAALDVVQETFERALTHAASLRDNTRFGGWLFGIAHQCCVRRFRVLRREADVFPAAADDALAAREEGLADPLLALISAETASELHALIERLPEVQRTALLLHVLGDLSLEEIAAAEEVPLGTVKSRLHTAKRALRTQFERHPQ